eukprot:gb/GECH01013829.1/.p1 GENE.gb/GECH01013829.1/~~gb/GECH01013829.1/.p1  ORF type:complete len:625 (+),score=144.25 gb/GECH01013829.1/:1-1875(+)
MIFLHTTRSSCAPKKSTERKSLNVSDGRFSPNELKNFWQTDRGVSTTREDMIDQGFNVSDVPDIYFENDFQPLFDKGVPKRNNQDEEMEKWQSKQGWEGISENKIISYFFRSKVVQKQERLGPQTVHEISMGQLPTNQAKNTCTNLGTAIGQMRNMIYMLEFDGNIGEKPPPKITKKIAKRILHPARVNYYLTLNSHRGQSPNAIKNMAKILQQVSKCACDNFYESGEQYRLFRKLECLCSRHRSAAQVRQQIRMRDRNNDEELRKKGKWLLKSELHQIVRTCFTRLYNIKQKWKALMKNGKRAASTRRDVFKDYQSDLMTLSFLFIGPQRLQAIGMFTIENIAFHKQTKRYTWTPSALEKRNRPHDPHLSFSPLLTPFIDFFINSLRPEKLKSVRKRYKTKEETTSIKALWLDAHSEAASFNILSRSVNQCINSIFPHSKVGLLDLRRIIPSILFMEKLDEPQFDNGQPTTTPETDRWLSLFARAMNSSVPMLRTHYIRASLSDKVDQVLEDSHASICMEDDLSEFLSALATNATDTDSSETSSATSQQQEMTPWTPRKGPWDHEPPELAKFLKKNTQQKTKSSFSSDSSYFNQVRESLPNDVELLKDKIITLEKELSQLKRK